MSTSYLRAQAVVTVTGDAWNPWLTGTGAYMADAPNDQQTGQGADDFVGGGGLYGFMQNAGLLDGVAGADSYVFRTRMNKYDSKGFGGNIILGGDLDGDGDVDLFFKVSDGPQGVKLSYALPGTGLNISPNTTSIITPWSGIINLTEGSTYDYRSTTGITYVGDATTDAYVSFAVSFSNLQTNIAALLPTAFPNFQVNYETKISFIAATSTQGNALNQDLYGTTGNTGSTLTWSELGASTAFTNPLGVIPEPATYVQVGLMLLTAGVVVWRRRRGERVKVLGPVESQVPGL